MDTKKRIMEKALQLFSEKGYQAVSVAQIALAVGIKAPSLYKHYQSKQAIFEAIVKEMTIRYEEQALSLQMQGDATKDVNVFHQIEETQLLLMGKHLFLYFLHDIYMCQFRKMLTIEQYHQSELSKMYTKQYFDDPLFYQTSIFTLLTKDKGITEEQTRIMALQFFSPIFVLLTLCDREPQREQEAITMLEQHIKRFDQLYKEILEERR